MLDDIETLYEHQTAMAVSIYSFLDNLLSAIQSPDNEVDNASTSELHDQLTDNTGKKIIAGGYSEDIFDYLSERDIQEFQCSICFCILKNTYQCVNKHKFCYGCIYVWSNTPGGGHDKCPMCRTDGLYAQLPDWDKEIGNKNAKCLLPKNTCNWRGLFKEYESHQHRQYGPVEQTHTKDPLPPIAVKEATAKVDNNSTVTVSESLDDGVTITVVGCPPFGKVQNSQIPTNSDLLNSTSETVDINYVSPSPVVPILSVPNDYNANRRTSTTHNVNSQNTNTSQGSRHSSVASSSNVSAQSVANVLVPKPPSVPKPLNNDPRRTSITATLANRRRSVSTAAVATGNGRRQSVNAAAATHPAVIRENSSNETTVGQIQELPFSTPRHSLDTATNISDLPPVATLLSSGDLVVQQPAKLDYLRLTNPNTERANRISDHLRERRDHLTILMMLMTVELDERRQAIHQAQNTAGHERERLRLGQLVEIQSLNQRLSLVSNNLGRLLDSRNFIGANSARSPSSAVRYSEAAADRTDDSSDSDV